MALIPVLPEGELVFQPADANGDSFENDGNIVIFALGPDTGFTIQFQNASPCNYSRKDHPEDHPTFDVVAAPGNTQVITRRLAPSRFNAAGGIASMTYSPSAVGIQVAAIRLSVVKRDLG